MVFSNYFIFLAFKSFKNAFLNTHIDERREEFFGYKGSVTLALATSFLLEELDKLFNDGKELGIYFYIMTGGEPLVRKNDILKLAKKHNDCVFIFFINGTLIDQKFCEDLIEFGNLVPTISGEGFDDATDGRRGKGS